MTDVAHEIELGYVGVEVADLDAFETFLTGIAGLMPGDAPHTWRADERVHRLIVSEGPRNDAAYLGFEAVDEAAFAKTVARLRAAGVALAEGTPEDCETRAVDALVHCVAPWGTPVEIVRGLRESTRPFASDALRGGFLTTGMGLGHAVFSAPDLDAAHSFVTDGLGMTQSDWLEMDAGGFTLNARFYHCNARHHTLALAAVPFDVPTKLHHLMLETNSVDDVGAAFDRAWDARMPIASGLGKHPNDEMFSFYVVTPAGFQMEIGHGARTITEPWTDNRAYDRISTWGHQPLSRTS